MAPSSLPTSQMWSASLSRSLRKEPLQSLTADRQIWCSLWWMPPLYPVMVKPGDHIFYFETPHGIEIENVVTGVPLLDATTKPT